MSKYHITLSLGDEEVQMLDRLKEAEHRSRSSMVAMLIRRASGESVSPVGASPVVDARRRGDGDG